MMDWLLQLNRWEWLGVYLVLCVVVSLFLGMVFDVTEGKRRRWYE